MRTLAFLLLLAPLSLRAEEGQVGKILASPLLERSLGMIQRQYWKGPLPENTLREAALQGILDHLNDLEGTKETKDEKRAWNRLLPPERRRLLNQELSGRFAGIGARIKLDEAEGVVLVQEALEGSPARKAGIESGDRIEDIDGKAVKGLDLPAVVSRLRGKMNSPVWLRIRRKESLLDFRFRRGNVEVPTVEERALGDGVAYLRIQNFHRGTKAAASVALKACVARGDRALVLDLRGNPGGSLDASVTTAGLFLETGSLVVTTVGNTGGKTEHRSRGPRIWTGPLCCLIDGTTASGAEILAAALRQGAKTLLAGEESFGKVNAQSLFELPGGYGLKLSTRRFALPGAGKDGRLLPDVPLARGEGEAKRIPLAEVSNDPWVQAARAMVKSRRQD